MELEELKVTDVWFLYEQGRDYNNMLHVYSDTDKNYRMYNGDQWNGLKVSGIEPVQLNIIKPIVKYKVGNINSNLWAIIFSSENFESREFRKTAEKTCELLNKKASKIWEADQMDIKIRKATKDSAINDESPMYVTYDEEKQMPKNEILNKNDVLYGNENDSDIQRQPYILIKQRRPVMEIQKMAEEEGVSKEDLELIRGDKNVWEEAGETAKYEKDDMCTLVTKMWKENGTVWFEKATKFVTVKKATNSGLKLYPLAHFVWEEKEGSARGEGEVRYLIPNQIEINKILMRSALVVKQTAYPQKIVNMDKVQNPSAVDQVGGVIKVKNGQSVDDVMKVFGHIQPAQMSSDVEKLRNELISMTRELAGAGDIATGSVNPEDASGKAILAVQQANQQPLVDQLTGVKTFIEDLGRIWLDHIITYSPDGITLEEDVTDPSTGEEYVQLVDIPQSVLLELQATVKVEITPKGAYDRYAQELSIQNLFTEGMFTPQRLGELKVYSKLLDDDAVMPKAKLEDAIEIMEEEQRKIAMIQARAQEMQQRANQFLNSDANAQAETIAQANQQVSAEREGMVEEREATAEEREAIAEEE